jgi:hypothetical protein
VWSLTCRLWGHPQINVIGLVSAMLHISLNQSVAAGNTAIKMTKKPHHRAAPGQLRLCFQQQPRHTTNHRTTCNQSTNTIQPTTQQRATPGNGPCSNATSMNLCSQRHTTTKLHNAGLAAQCRVSLVPSSTNAPRPTPSPTLCSTVMATALWQRVKLAQHKFLPSSTSMQASGQCVSNDLQQQNCAHRWPCGTARLMPSKLA